MELVGCLVFLAATALIGVMRWQYVIKRRLALEDLERIGSEMLRKWRPFAADIGASFKVSLDTWQSFGLSNLEALEVARYLMGRGWLTAPNYDPIFNVLQGVPPTSVAFTRNSWGEFSLKSPGVVVNGPLQVGDGNTQFNSGTFDYGHRTEIHVRLDSLAMEVYSAADRIGDAEMSAKLERVADALSRAASDGDVSSSRLRTALRWLVDRANDAGAEVVSAGIGAAATSLLISLR